MDVERLRASFKRVAELGDQLAVRLYATLDVEYPELHDLFPAGMAAQRKRFVRALVKIVSEVDRLDVLTPYVRELGESHFSPRRVTADMYPKVGRALLLTLEFAERDNWTRELAADWAEAYGLLAKVMTDAADEYAKRHPAFWEGTVRASWRPVPDVAVLHVATGPAAEWEPGQHVTVEAFTARPREFREYSPAGPPNGETMELHVRVLGSGGVSDALAGLPDKSPLRFGRPDGGFTLAAHDPGPGMMMAAESTGIAPVKAIVRQLAAASADPPAVMLLYGGARPEYLYELEDLRKLAARCSWLTVIPVTDGPVHEVITHAGLAIPSSAWLAGPAAMVKACAAALDAAGLPPEHVHTENFRWDEPERSDRP